jgi:hypothetical protein
MERSVSTPESDADVVGLDVAVGNARPFQEDDGLKEVLSEAMEQIETEPAFLAQTLAHGLVAGLIEENGHAIGELEDTVATGDKGVVELLENLAFVTDAVVVVRIDGDLGHKLLVLLADQHSGRGRTGAELPDDFIATRQNVAGFGVSGIADELIARRRQLVFDLIKELDELEVGPGPIGFMGWELPAHDFQRIPLPGILGFRHRNPITSGVPCHPVWFVIL